MLRNLIAGVALIASLLPMPVAAQTGGELALFSKGQFKGARTAIAGPVQFSQPVVARSLTVPSGSAWELCSGKTYTGCRQFSASTAAMVMTIRSARPVAAILPSSAGAAAVRRHRHRTRTIVARPGERIFRRPGRRRQPDRGGARHRRSDDEPRDDVLPLARMAFVGPWPSANGGRTRLSGRRSVRRSVIVARLSAL